MPTGKVPADMSYRISRRKPTLLAALAALAATLGLAGALSSSAQASYPAKTAVSNYVKFTSFDNAQYIGAGSAFKPETFHLDTYLTNGDNQSVHLQWTWEGHNFGGAGQSERIEFEANVYDQFVSCQGQPTTQFNTGFVDVIWYRANGQTVPGTYSTPCE